MKLELKHIAPYLPYNVKVIDLPEKAYIWELHPFKDCLDSLNAGDFLSLANFIKENNNDEDCCHALVLRPLSDLTKEIEHNGETFTPIDVLVDKMQLTVGGLSKFGITNRIINETFTIDNWAFEKLLSWHFDVFGLIDEGLAIDINTLNK